jgi:hypothetical protein
MDYHVDWLKVLNGARYYIAVIIENYKQHHLKLHCLLVRKDIGTLDINQLYT